MDLPEAKHKFISDELWSLAIRGSFSVRGTGNRRVYTDRRKISEAEKNKFRDWLRCRITKLEESYQGCTSTNDHLKNMDKLKRDITDRFSCILHDHRITLGVVQKLLNLHLKYQWSWGRLPNPPNCPFDAKIIRKLGSHLQPEFECNWTRLDSADDYLALVEAAERAANHDDKKSIAEWELEEWK